MPGGRADEVTTRPGTLPRAPPACWLVPSRAGRVPAGSRPCGRPPQHTRLPTSPAARQAASRHPPTPVRTLFEGTGSAQTAIAEADAERRAIAELAAARAAVPTSVDPPTWLGLMGTRPDAMLASATDAFARGNLPAAVQSAQDAKAIWQVAPDTGRRRFAALVLSVLIILALTLLVTRARRGGRRARRVMRREGRS